MTENDHYFDAIADADPFPSCFDDVDEADSYRTRNDDPVASRLSVAARYSVTSLRPAGPLSTSVVPTIGPEGKFGKKNMLFVTGTVYSSIWATS